MRLKKMLMVFGTFVMIASVMPASASSVFEEVDARKQESLFDEAAGEEDIFEVFTAEEEADAEVAFVEVDDEECLASAINGWKQSGGYWYYYSDGMMMKNRFARIGTARYYFDTTGKMAVGWKKINGLMYFFRDNGTQKESGWKQNGSDWYYFKNSEPLANTFEKIGTAKYYFYPDGKMAVGWIRIDGKLYCFRDNGSMKETGWKQNGNDWYYFENGPALANTMKKIGNATYAFDSTGKMRTGLVTLNGKIYYFGSNGIRKEEGWKDVDTKRYYFENGSAVTGFKTIGTATYYFDTNGRMTTGWITVNGSTYYCRADGTLATGTVTIDGKSYEFGPDGKLKPVAVTGNAYEFINWMLKKTNLTTQQKNDLNAAKKVLDDAQKASFSAWDKSHSNLSIKVTGMHDKAIVLSDEKDTTSMKNIQKGIDILKRTNVLRANDVNYNYTGHKLANAKTNFYIMAVAEANTMFGAAFRNHAQWMSVYGGECLAFGSTTPADAWYSEISYFQNAKKALGMDPNKKLTTAAELTKVQNKIGDWYLYGHYDIMMEMANTTMGAAVTDYGLYNRTTSGLNTLYSAGNMATYSVEQFEALFIEYQNSLK